MEAAAVTFAEREVGQVAIQQEAFDHSGCDGCETQLALLQESLTSEHHKQQLETIAGIDRRCQESHEAGILEEKEHW